jgi:hypothetical protein
MNLILKSSSFEGNMVILIPRNELMWDNKKLDGVCFYFHIFHAILSLCVYIMHVHYACTLCMYIMHVRGVGLVSESGWDMYYWPKPNNISDQHTTREREKGKTSRFQQDKRTGNARWGWIEKRRKPHSSSSSSLRLTSFLSSPSFLSFLSFQSVLLPPPKAIVVDF